MATTSSSISPDMACLYNMLDQQQLSFSIPSQMTPNTSSPTQDLMNDYRTNTAMLFLNDPSSPSFNQPPSYQGYPAPSSFMTRSSAATPCPTSSVPSSITDVKDEHQSQVPFFSDLCQMIMSECQLTSLPSSLFQFSSHQQDVTSREAALLARLRRLEQTTGEKVKDLSSLFRHHSASIEMERVQMLSMDNTLHYRDWLNSHFDQQRHQVMDRVEKSLHLLESKAESEKMERDQNAGIRRRTPLTRRSIQLMESWYASHQDHPYPSTTVVEALSRSGNITMDQVRKWFANKRIRNCNTRSLTEIAKKKHQAKFGVKAVQLAFEQDLF